MSDSPLVVRFVDLDGEVRVEDLRNGFALVTHVATLDEAYEWVRSGGHHVSYVLSTTPVLPLVVLK